jgi:hypothetical protein
VYNLPNRRFLEEIDFTSRELDHLLTLAAALKAAKYAGKVVWHERVRLLAPTRSTPSFMRSAAPATESAPALSDRVREHREPALDGSEDLAHEHGVLARQLEVRSRSTRGWAKSCTAGEPAGSASASASGASVNRASPATLRHDLLIPRVGRPPAASDHVRRSA